MLHQYDCSSVDINTPSFPRGGERRSSVIFHPCFITNKVTPGMDHLASPILVLSNMSHSNMFTHTHMLCLAHDPFCSLI